MTAHLDDLGTSLAAAVPFVRHLGLAVDADREHQRVLLPDAAELANHVGTHHAGALFTAAETATGAAVVAVLARTGIAAVPVVGHAEIRYERPARGPITAAPTLRRTDAELVGALAESGRAELPVQVTLTDELGVAVASAWFSWVLRQPRSAS